MKGKCDLCGRDNVVLRKVSDGEGGALHVCGACRKDKRTKAHREAEKSRERMRWTPYQ